MTKNNTRKYSNFVHTKLTRYSQEQQKSTLTKWLTEKLTRDASKYTVAFKAVYARLHKQVPAGRCASSAVKGATQP